MIPASFDLQAALKNEKRLRLRQRTRNLLPAAPFVLPGLILAIRDDAGVLDLEATGVEQRVEPIRMTDRNYMKTNRKKYLDLDYAKAMLALDLSSLSRRSEADKLLAEAIPEASMRAKRKRSISPEDQELSFTSGRSGSSGRR